MRFGTLRSVKKGYGLAFPILIIFVVHFGSSWCFATENPNFPDLVPRTHPRVILDTDAIAMIKERSSSYCKKEYEAVRDYTMWRIRENTPKQIATAYCVPEVIIPIALTALISGDRQIIEYTISCAVEMVKVGPSIGDDTGQRFRLLCLAIIYDWLNGYLKEWEKVLLGDGIVAHIVELEHFMRKPSYTGGHSRFGNAAILAGTLAIFGEREEMSGNEVLKTLKMHWENGFNQVQGFIAEEGGYHMGWQYGLGFTSLWPYLLWSKTEIPNPVPAWIEKLPSWYLYGLTGDGQFPWIGDCNDANIGQYLCPIMAYCSYKFKDGYAE